MATYRVPVLQDFSWQPPVEDKDLTAPPGGESKGDRYIVGAEATGDWSGLDNHIVTYNGSGWIDDTPAEGWYVYVKDENVLYHYTGAAWDADDISALEADVTSIDTRVSNVESSVGSIDTHVDSCDSSIVSIDTRATNIESSVGSIDTHVDSCDSSIVSIDTRATNIESSTGSINTRCDANESDISTNSLAISNANSSIASINTAKQDKGTYVSEYGAIEFTI